MTPAVAKAIDQIKLSLPSCEIEATHNGDGGANVVVRGMPLGTPYTHADTWIGFLITFQYPYADIYPHFTRPDLARLDGASLKQGLGGAQFLGMPATQISRRSNHWNAEVDTAILKLLKVHKWLLSD